MIPHYILAHDGVEKYENLFPFMNQEVKKAPPGSNGVIFTPWLHGRSSPCLNFHHNKIQLSRYDKLGRDPALYIQC